MPLLSLVIPTYNERENLPILLSKLASLPSEIEREIIIVDDDSPDKTWELARFFMGQYPWLRVVRRVQEKGLSSAVIRGFEIATGDILAVMDADLQHDEQALIRFIEQFEEGADIVVGSRKAEGGGVENWTPARRLVSLVATLMAAPILPQTITDPMSGFFALRREVYERFREKINPRGFKILLEFLALARDCEIREVGYIFRGRIHGESKLSGRVMFDYLLALYDLGPGRYVPVRFLKYSLVGTSGFLLSSVILFLCQNFAQMSPLTAFSLSVEPSILTNFFLNNHWTFREEKLQGKKRILRGLLYFHIVCLCGAFINGAVAIKLISLGMNIYVANAGGYVFAAVWNYIINVNTTWKRI